MISFGAFYDRLGDARLIVVVSLFLSDPGILGMGAIVATLFVAAMFPIMGALIFLIFEASIRTRKMRLGLEHLYCPWWGLTQPACRALAGLLRTWLRKSCGSR